MTVRVDELELMKTVEARIALDDELAKTLVRMPHATIHPARHASHGGLQALERLRELSRSGEARLAMHQTLGEGGMGVVHLATQATLGRFVAVKTLRAGVGDEHATLRILREAWVTGALEHPNVVPVYDVAIDEGGSPVIVMKRIEGRAWCDLVHRPDEIASRFGARDALEWNLGIFANVCNAIHFAHSRGILHRDLKPENVMIGAFGEVYVLDWGIAVALRDDASGRIPSASSATEIAGTPAYMAPEMMLGDPTRFSERTDVFLLGAVLYEIFSGGPPNRGDSVHAIVSSVLLAHPPYAEGFPREARRICEKAMAKEPSARFASAEELRLAVEEYRRHRGSRKLARDAHASLDRLVATIEGERHGEERTLAIFNLLGECRFGYRAALSAWPENEAAAQGLDRALVAVAEHELAEGDPRAAARLLKEASRAPVELQARVEAAVKQREEDDARRRRLEADHDARVGRRTRTTIGSIFGVMWTLIPLFAWLHHVSAGGTTHTAIFASTIGCFALWVGLIVWARDTMNRTLVNRRLGLTLGAQFFLQMVLASGAALAGLSPAVSQTFLVLSWSFTETMLAIWIEPFFAVTAIATSLSFLAASAWPSALYPLMAADNAIFTIVLVRVWFPMEDLAWLREQGAKGALPGALAQRVMEERARRRRAEPQRPNGNES